MSTFALRDLARLILKNLLMKKGLPVCFFFDTNKFLFDKSNKKTKNFKRKKVGTDGILTVERWNFGDTQI